MAFLSFFPVKVPKIEIYIESSNILKFKFRKLKLQILFSSKFKISEVSKSHTSFRFQKLGKTFRKPIVRFLKVAKNERQVLAANPFVFETRQKTCHFSLVKKD